MDKYAFSTGAKVGPRDMSLAREIVRSFIETKKKRKSAPYVLVSNWDFAYRSRGKVLPYREEQFRASVAKLLVTELVNIRTMRTELLFDAALVDVPMSGTAYLCIKSTPATIVYSDTTPGLETIAFADEVEK